MEIKERVHARVGLLGNPSDGYFGCCISFSLTNFWAEVSLVPSRKLVFLPSPIHDSYEYESLQQLHSSLQSSGYYGGVRLMQAMVKTFFEWCRANSIELPPEKNFTLSYSTNIPRQTGMSGSSAICCAALSCLMKHYAVADHISLEVRPNLVLAAEKALGITAGLQDRVIQVYGGMMFMDFKEDHMKRQGHGEYHRMDAGLLELSGSPGLLQVMYAECPSDSGAVHADVRQRWERGDVDVVTGMHEVAECARAGRLALESQDFEALAKLIDRNFDLRRKMFGDQVLGAHNLGMIHLARSLGCSAKFTGSGGAVLVLCPQGEGQAARLRGEAAKQGLNVVPVSVPPPLI